LVEHAVLEAREAVSILSADIRTQEGSFRSLWSSPVCDRDVDVSASSQAVPLAISRSIDDHYVYRNKRPTDTTVDKKGPSDGSSDGVRLDGLNMPASDYALHCGGLV
jgi:hypothetical protein